ncbi:MAG: DNA adenine methylase [Candidatus Marinimicrobia bacterium]|nr:DNA adenine methylase [Candidatus Neomarinimicrobiota bacterium]
MDAANQDSLISWVGGKKQLRKTISQYIPNNIQGYIEPFGGAGWLLFYKSKWAQLEVYNDINSDLVNVFRIAKYHPEALLKEYEYMMASRELFGQVRANPGFTEIQREARFMFLLHRSFGAIGEHFGTSKLTPVKSQQHLLKKIDLVSKRLDKVMIEHLSFEELVTKYDDPQNFFFCDPPYFHGHDYDLKFDHMMLYDVLSEMEGKWLLTYDDCQEARDLFQGYWMKSMVRQKGIERKHGDMEYKEVLIANYEPIKQGLNTELWDDE